MKIVTGYTGQPHITSNAVQGFNQGIFGNGNYVLNVGSKFAAELTNANTVSIADGEGVLQGVHFRIEPGTTENVNIANGTTGYKRIDYICARYTKNAITGVESVDLVVVQGTPASSSPVAPTVNTGDILLGASPVDFPLYEVDLDGLTPTITSLCTRVGQIVSPPDFTKLKSVPDFHPGIGNSFSVTMDIPESGWYSLFISRTPSANDYLMGRVCIYLVDNWLDVAAGVLHAPEGYTVEWMSPWLYFEKGTSINFQGTRSGSLYYCPCL